jgi:hypothetical protein
MLLVFYWLGFVLCTDALFFFFFFFCVCVGVCVDKLCTDAITLMAFTGGWGPNLFALTFFFNCFYTLTEYIVICVSVVL